MSTSSSDCEYCEGTGFIPCHTCNETGMGRFGDPDTSLCAACGGKGEIECVCSRKRRESDAYDAWKDRRKYGLRKR